MKPISVLVVDDDATVRDGLTALLETQPDLRLVGEAADGLEAIEKAEGLRPDVVLMDLGMPLLDGLEATRRIKERYPETRVIVLNLYGTQLREALKAGASRFLLKDCSPADLMQAIRET